MAFYYFLLIVRRDFRAGGVDVLEKGACVGEMPVCMDSQPRRDPDPGLAPAEGTVVGCFHVAWVGGRGGAGVIRVRVADLCPWCAAGLFLLMTL